MLDRNALRLTGGAGGIDDVGELLRRAAGCKICVRVLPQQLAIGVETEDLPPLNGEFPAENATA